MLQLRSLVAAVALLTAALLPSAAHAAFAGTNGKIAFISSRDANFEIYTMNPDGSGQTRLTTNPASDLDPAWSPDGQRIAFDSNRGGAFDVYVMTAGGRRRRRSRALRRTSSTASRPGRPTDSASRS